MKLTPVVFVHGLFGTLEDPSIRAAFRSRVVFAPDLLGYGEFSEAAADSITIASQIVHLRERILERFSRGPVHLVGHSAGSVVASLFAYDYPDLVESIVNVEGNITLRDAFWSAPISKMTHEQAMAMLNDLRAEPAKWLARSGAPAEWREIATASKWLTRQPASTVRAMSTSIVAETTKPEFVTALQEVFARHPVHLVAGERSRREWDTPAWALEQAASFTLVAGVGHLMMVEDPAKFGRLIANLLASSDRK